MEFKMEKNKISYKDKSGRELAYITFPEIAPGIVDINHTIVDPSLQGQGMAGKLVEAAAKQLQADGRKANLSCTYAKTWFEKHEEYKDLLE